MEVVAAAAVKGGRGGERGAVFVVFRGDLGAGAAMLEVAFRRRKGSFFLFQSCIF